MLKRAKYAHPQQATAEVAEQQGGQQQPDNQEQNTIILRPGVITAPEPPRTAIRLTGAKRTSASSPSSLWRNFVTTSPFYRLQERYWRLGRVWLARIHPVRLDERMRACSLSPSTSA
ncbi:MAG: hypothetical protein R3F19_23680 [Verrucomicrobiales bacterium]